MKIFFSLLAISLFAAGSLSAEPEMKNCHCLSCKCTPENHCGCFSDEGCHCDASCQEDAGCPCSMECTDESCKLKK